MVSRSLREFDVITFDCYGTLVDWESGILEAFSRQISGDRMVDPARLIELYHEVEPQVQGTAYRSYREVLTEVARQIAGQLGWQLNPGEAAFLPESILRWSPFPDTVPALEALRADGYELGILSNIDDDLLGETLSKMAIPFEFLITAQQVRSYKPAPGHFLEARSRIGEKRWIHVAQSYFHDIEPAADLGVPSLWVNRKRERRHGRGRPLADLPDLRSLIEWLRRAPDEP